MSENINVNSKSVNNYASVQRDSENSVSPWERVNFISRLFFWWMYPIVRLGSRKEIEIGDLFTITKQYESKELQQKLEKHITINNETGERLNLMMVILHTFGKRYFVIGLWQAIYECFLKIVRPICLGMLLRYCFDSTPISNETSTTSFYGYLYATAIVILSALIILISQLVFFEYQLMSLRIKSALCSLIHKKCLKLSQEALGQTNIGQIINLMSNDVNRFDRFVDTFHFLWIAPLQVVITTTILYYLVIGPASFVGMGILLVFVPFQFGVGKLLGRMRYKTAKKTDERVNSMSEILSGMRVVKLYAWEEPFVKLINLCRKAEVRVIRHTSFIRAISDSFYFSASKLIIFLTFLVYILTDLGTLSPYKVFMTVILFDNIRSSMIWYFPSAIACVAELKISIMRIQSFLQLDEVDNINKKSLDTKEIEKHNMNAVKSNIEFKEVTVKWPGSSVKENENVLSGISFTAWSGQIVTIVGQVGSGKSSLLHVILGELRPLSGQCRVTGKISYAPQVPWLFSDGSIRQNILCGLDYDAKRYKRVLKATALKRDLAQLTFGDQTIVGERGVTLSGGQKTRIGLARCLYVDADTYLLDDPLSAVDNHVGQHIFEKAISKFLSGKLCVLITHQLQYLRKVDQILVFEKGTLIGTGTFEELFDSNNERIQMCGENSEIGLVNQKEVTKINDITEKSVQKFYEVIGKSSKKLDEESRLSGNVPISTYWDYLHSGAGYLSFMALVINCIAAQVFFNVTDYWLSYFANIEQTRAYQTSFTNSSKNQSTYNTLEEEIDTFRAISVYSIVISFLVLFSFLRTYHFFIICSRSSINLHKKMLEAIVRAPISFFERNSVGRIFNRFTKDLGCMDDQLPQYYLDTIVYSLFVIGTIVLVSVVQPWLILSLVFPAALMYYLTKQYVTTSRSLKRLEAICRSPVFTHTSSSLNGLTTIRAHRCQDKFQEMFNNLQDIHTSVSWILIASIRWFAVWIDFICVFYITCVTFSCVYLRESLSGSEAGLVISCAMSLVVELQWGIRQSTETENQMTSVERIMEYCKIQPEAPLQSESNFQLKTWPQNGNIKFDCVYVRYRKTDQPALKNISFFIEANEKIGIVGRTGAGNSSLIAALFRLSEPEGKILIDGVDIKSIGLHQLRSKISIIPQDPILFAGTLRKNLDPFKEFPDDILLSALEDVKLKESIKEGLEFVVTHGGSNLSVGERQLVCLARAILRNNKILVLDEATANVDQKTDEFIQSTLREKFVDCTVLTIAHRLNTIMDSNRVMVLDSGNLMEFDEPAILLENKQGIFAQLVEQTSASRS